MGTYYIELMSGLNNSGVDTCSESACSVNSTARVSSSWWLVVIAGGSALEAGEFDLAWRKVTLVEKRAKFK